MTTKAQSTARELLRRTYETWPEAISFEIEARAWFGDGTTVDDDGTIRQHGEAIDDARLARFAESLARQGRLDNGHAYSAAELYDLLDAHDWHYAISDDDRTYSRGAVQSRRLARIANTSDAHRALYDAFFAHHRVRTSDSAQPPLPERPEEG